MADTIRAELRMRVRPGCEVAFERAWREAAEEIARVPGNLGQALARDLADPRTYVITSDWADRQRLEAFGSSDHRERLTTALRDLREDAQRRVYEVRDAMSGAQPTSTEDQ
ncbi:antibiotic biosynthesis monooxygenase [Candidatus Protofrankia californiensis]|uniref:Antibiotic biosynthesis monooxygenase n=1 Tax=Candidatus Protofrankia californiensis TaxID=1839754 RepID=A0A1C3P025_9ACTN|nr:antibiotic biosynthesis monooxygenase [Candidatus Protofrankia californiensis]